MIMWIDRSVGRIMALENSPNKLRFLGSEVNSGGRASFRFGMLCHIPGQPYGVSPLGKSRFGSRCGRILHSERDGGADNSPIRP